MGSQGPFCTLAPTFDSSIGFSAKKNSMSFRREREENILPRAPQKIKMRQSFASPFYLGGDTDRRRKFISVDAAKHRVANQRSHSTQLFCFFRFFFLLELCRGRSKQAQTKVEPLRQRTGKV
jgi:hypothetical protein